ncbi:catalase/peroxidase HPI [Anopheles sinensis]|uniref:Catalase/peroxidase HPI n=1 Tax=Anopheles sinensis TaxID=74873 RepID=A0A084WK12_ANOSI|nr:catalase/peroxidase HPI [Anopheles sinensis]
MKDTEGGRPAGRGIKTAPETEHSNNEPRTQKKELTFCRNNLLKEVYLTECTENIEAEVVASGGNAYIPHPAIPVVGIPFLPGRK